MIRKKHAHLKLDNANSIEMTDSHGGSGHIKVEGVGQGRVVYDAPEPPKNSWGGYSHRPYHYEYDHWRVVGTAVPEGYPMVFGLKVYDDGGRATLPASLAGTTLFKTKDEAAACGEAWLAAGGPGLALESLAETQTRHRAERSAGVYSKIARMVSGLTDEDLLKLSESALKTVTKRAEKFEADRSKREEKARKAVEKVRVAEEKAQKKAAVVAAKALKDAAKAQKQAAAAAKLASKVTPQVLSA